MMKIKPRGGLNWIIWVYLNAVMCLCEREAEGNWIETQRGLHEDGSRVRVRVSDM